MHFSFWRFISVLVGLGVVVALAFAMQPQPVLVDLATASRGPLVVTVHDDGQTRIRERYVVSAPLAGRLLRVELDPGDAVAGGETLLTTIEPTDPALLDPRAVAQAEARVKAAEARFRQAEPRLEAAQEAMELAETELGRVRRLFEKASATPQQRDEAESRFRQRSLEFRAAQFEQDIAAFELEQAKAALTRTSSDEIAAQGWRFPIRSPISGCVLRVLQESATVVTPGTPLLEVGDPADLEVVVDLLSTDAVRVRAGARVMLQEWGGKTAIPAHVRRVEPAAFTKISALGIEEQRVNVIIDFAEPADARPPLGDGFRVEADIVEWESKDVLKVPAGALFRQNDQWAVFVVRSGRAAPRVIQLGHRNDDEAEVLDGLTDGDQIVLYPGDRVTPDARVGQREL